MPITDRLLEVLRYQLAQEQFVLEPPAHPDDPLTVSQDGEPLAYLAGDGFLWPPANRPQQLATRHIARIAAQVWEMERSFQQAPVMDVPPPHEYRRLLSSRQYVLAARYDGQGQFTFVTWEYAPYDRNWLLYGRYFQRNAFAEAKEDFLHRSGLAQGLVRLEADELCIIRQALLFRGMEDKGLQAAEREAVDHMLQRLDTLLLPADRALWEAEQDMEQDMLEDRG